MSNKIVSFQAENVSDLGTMTGHTLLFTDFHSLDPACILILIIAGKVLMNVLIFWASRKTVSASFLGYSCIAVAGIDFVLLFAISAIHYFQDFSILGVRFTSYHICLFTQIISRTYGIMHFPIFLVSCVDYYLTIVKSKKLLWISPGLLYTICVLLLWTGAFTHVLQSPVESLVLDSEQSTYQCTFYVSQSFYLSVALVFTIVVMLAFCCFEMVTLIKTMKVISFAKNTVVLLSFPPGDKWPISGAKRFISALLFSFLGTWALFLVLQIIILAFCAHIPGYMDMNIPWLYFMNSFLIGVAFGLKYPDLQVTENIFSIDPFICWKYCVLPFITAEHYKGDPFLNELPSSVMTI
ncbi:putative G-protein coupled receptor 160 [Mixophyes fleayi]|uniref:putative G-protein coupled receptor 160 n=1 Tax=Mixophyes fleayi TaxID=3061075 RepID=UPI003F4E1806